jgi:phage regulator Rha-like protein
MARSLSLVKDKIESKILFIRGSKVMLDRDLAKLYGVETKLLKRAVRRNISRFPKDFMFELSQKEHKSIRCQFGTFKKGEHSKYLPYAFTQEGVAMLSSVLNSERAIQANIQIMRAFVKLRELMATHENLKKKIEEMEKKYDYQFKIVFDAIKQLLESPRQEPKKQVGFHP